MIRLVVCDIDCTLVRSDEVVPKEAIAMKNELEARGIHFSLATGRVECMAEKFVKALQLEVPYVLSNGATVRQGEKVIRRLQIPVSPLRSFIEKVDRMDIAIVYSIGGKEWYWRENPYLSVRREEFGIYKDQHQFSEEEWKTLTIDKLSIFTDTYVDRVKALEEDAKALDNRFAYTRYVDRSIEIVAREATKANGVKILAESLGLTMNEVLFCGDHQNDIELIQAAGIGVAVGNSTPDAKAAADYIAQREYFDGVKEAVDKFVLQRNAI